MFKILGRSKLKNLAMICKHVRSTSLLGHPLPHTPGSGQRHAMASELGRQLKEPIPCDKGLVDGLPLPKTLAVDAN